jgi:hypothetical protein
MKYVIFKGIEGFADRLQCLLFIIKYAKKVGRILIVDWGDPQWCNDESKNFDYYFYLEGMNYMKIEDFKKIFNDDMSIHPVVWKNKLFDVYGENIYNDKYLLQNRNSIILKIIQKGIDDFKEDIIVYPGVYTRIHNSLLFKQHFRLQQHVLDFIKNHQFYKNIISKKIPYTCIHLRGGDRMNTENKYSNNSHNIEEYLNKLGRQINTNFENVLVISDTQILIDHFIKKNIDRNITIHTTNNFKVTDKIGLHKITFEGDTKEEINLEMIRDLYFYISSTYKISDNISLFSKFTKNLEF